MRRNNLYISVKGSTTSPTHGLSSSAGRDGDAIRGIADGVRFITRRESDVISLLTILEKHGYEITRISYKGPALTVSVRRFPIVRGTLDLSSLVKTSGWEGTLGGRNDLSTR